MPIEIQLSQNTPGRTNVRARVPGTSRWWYILRFTPDGKIILNASVPSHLGFKIDRDGCVITKKETEIRDLN